MKESAVIKWFKNVDNGWKYDPTWSDGGFQGERYTKGIEYKIELPSDYWFESLPNVCERWNENLRKISLGIDEQIELNWYNVPHNKRSNKS